MSYISDYHTVEQVKKYLDENKEAGVPCPCCNQLVKQYRRKLNSGMAFVLIEMYRADKENDFSDGWFHVIRVMAKRKVNATTLEYNKLVHWGFIESKKESGLPEKKSTGYWRITQKGKDFVEGLITVPTYIHLFKGDFLGLSGDEISIRQALGKRFDYTELMMN